MKDCFVKLGKMENAKIPTIKQDLSDDDFDTFTSTPRENIRARVDKLEKEIEEKRLIVDELRRAKLCKKMHDTNELKNLTSIWKSGCVIALNDLLKQLNKHSQIDMVTLLKKLNIPQDTFDFNQL
ncbi:hypothetical protein HHI36_009348 [Cryptolaemus montrouzieri]|uniref:Swi5-dependent recombination DNA repair protein 1 homolog n=1 Tax=Cryptolaemus montrouzieri TaxID=559131 RepID=A0ABD2MVP0_9CUCU